MCFSVQCSQWPEQPSLLSYFVPTKLIVYVHWSWKPKEAGSNIYLLIHLDITRFSTPLDHHHLLFIRAQIVTII